MTTGSSLPAWGTNCGFGTGKLLQPNSLPQPDGTHLTGHDDPRRKLSECMYTIDACSPEEEVWYAIEAVTPTDFLSLACAPMIVDVHHGPVSH